jgi:hypothetical protein
MVLLIQPSQIAAQTEVVDVIAAQTEDVVNTVAQTELTTQTVAFLPHHLLHQEQHQDLNAQTVLLILHSQIAAQTEAQANTAVIMVPTTQTAVQTEVVDLSAAQTEPTTQIAVSQPDHHHHHLLLAHHRLHQLALNQSVQMVLLIQPSQIAAPMEVVDNIAAQTEPTTQIAVSQPDHHHHHLLLAHHRLHQLALNQSVQMVLLIQPTQIVAQTEDEANTAVQMVQITNNAACQPLLHQE